MKRDPSSKVDPLSAMQVLNSRHTRIGYVDKVVATLLSDVINRGLVTKTEGVITGRAADSSTLTLSITLMGLASDKDAVQSTPAFLNAGPFVWTPALTIPSVRRVGSGDSLAHPPAGMGGGSSADVDKEVDQIFEQIGRNAAKCSPLEAPADLVTTPILPHQALALAWLVRREHNTDLPPLWEKRGKLFYNTATKTSTSLKPHVFKGGIFADDMG